MKKRIRFGLLKVGFNLNLIPVSPTWISILECSMLSRITSQSLLDLIPFSNIIIAPYKETCHQLLMGGENVSTKIMEKDNFVLMRMVDVDPGGGKAPCGPHVRIRQIGQEDQKKRIGSTIGTYSPNCRSLYVISASESSTEVWSWLGCSWVTCTFLSQLGQPGGIRYCLVSWVD